MCRSNAERRTRNRWLFVLTSQLLACGSTNAEQAELPQQGVPAAECAPPSGVSNRPGSITETVALIDALPKPLTLPCFLRALGRPLAVSAWLSNVSAQLAPTPESPRLFLRIGGLTASVVPTGDGAHLLELAEDRPDLHSLKGELAFPIEQQLAPEAPYEQALFSAGVTTCAFCHADERPEKLAHGGDGFVSRAIRPHPAQRVPLASVANEAKSCDPEREPFRCQLLQGLFGVGPTIDWDFPVEMEVCGD